jgi:hypothetical protein
MRRVAAVALGVANDLRGGTCRKRAESPEVAAKGSGQGTKSSPVYRRQRFLTILNEPPPALTNLDSDDLARLDEILTRLQTNGRPL